MISQIYSEEIVICIHEFSSVFFEFLNVPWYFEYSEEFFDYLFSFADFLLLNISKEGCLQFTINIKNYTFFFFQKSIKI